MTRSPVATFLLDVNVLLALSLPTHQHHASATGWFASVDSWATTALTETAYLRLMTNPRVIGFDVTTEAALAALRQMRTLPGHAFVEDGTSLADPAIDVRALVGGSQVTDFHLVNLAARRAAMLATFDASLHRALAAADRRYLHVLSD